MGVKKIQNSKAETNPKEWKIGKTKISASSQSVSDFVLRISNFLKL